MDMDMDLDLDLELGTMNLLFHPTECCLWHIASPGQQLEKKLLYPQQVADRFRLTTRDLEILHSESATGFYFRQINDCLLLAFNPLAIIWNNSVCYVSYNDNISSIRFRDFVSAAESWVSSGLPFHNSFVIQAALRLICECVQDELQILKSNVEDSSCFSISLHDLREDESFFSIMSKKFIVDIFESGSPAVAFYLEPKQFQECLKPWNSILEQLDSIRAMLDKKLQRKFANNMVLIVVFVLLMVAAIGRIPLYRVFVYVFIAAAVCLMRWYASIGLF